MLQMLLRPFIINITFFQLYFKYLVNYFKENLMNLQYKICKLKFLFNLQQFIMKVNFNNINSFNNKY